FPVIRRRPRRISCREYGDPPCPRPTPRRSSKKSSSTGTSSIRCSCPKCLTKYSPTARPLPSRTSASANARQTRATPASKSGRQGLRVFPAEVEARHELFEFMASPVSSEKPKGVSVREIAAAMRRSRAAGEKIIAVLGPAVVHTGGGEYVGRLIRAGYVQVLFAGNALATHDIEQALYGTSLGVSMERGLPTHEGHE